MTWPQLLGAFTQSPLTWPAESKAVLQAGKGVAGLPGRQDSTYMSPSFIHSFIHNPFF